MADKSGDFTFELDPEAAKRFVKVLESEGLIPAGHVAHNANNVNVTVKAKTGEATPGKTGQT
jgi:hypothetical protein